MNRSIEVVTGQRFREAGVNAFGAPSRAVWVVGRTWRGTDRIEYAELVHDSDPGRRKTLSTGTLADRKLFIPDVDRIREQVFQSSVGGRLRLFKPFARFRKRLT